MAELWKHIQKLRRGGGTALLRGFPGSGKTTFLVRFTERACAAGMRVVYATGSAHGPRTPLEVVEQLFGDGRHFGGPSPLATLVQVYRAAVSRGDARAEERLMLEARALVERALLDLVGRAPVTLVVVVVDDAHRADEASMRIIRFLAGRLVRARVFFVLAGSTHPGKEYRAAQAELMRSARLFVGELTALEPRDAARLLHEETGQPPTPGYVRKAMEVTAGNPRLLWAIARDTRAEFQGVPCARWVPVPGAAFRDAVSDLVSGTRCELVERVARALAVLGTPRSPDLLGRLSGTEQAPVANALELLEVTGLVCGHRFRHPAIRAAVLEDVAFTGRAELSRTAARLLYRDGAAALEVARCIAVTGGAVAAWEVSALREAARQAQSEGNWAQAVDLLELAQSFRGTLDDRCALLMQTALAQWQLDPYLASRHLADLVALAGENRLSVHELALLAQMLAWHGRLDEVDTVRRALREKGAHDSSAHAELCLVDALLGRVLARYRAPAAQPPPDIPAWREELFSLPAAGSTATDAHFLRLVDHIQQALFADSETEAPITDVIHYYLRLLDQAGTQWPVLPRIDAVSAAAAERLSPFHQLLLCCLQAVSAIGRGDLAHAEHKARAVLVRPAAWGVAIGLPLGVLAVAMTRRGKHAEVAELLNIPVPSALYCSSFGRSYLFARGLHHFMVKSYGLALSDFLGCGEVERGGGFPPGPASPWQPHAAEAYLLLGRHDEAVRLAEDGLGSDFGRTRAVALRVLALTRPVERRRKLLHEAMGLLEESGDRAELADCLVELGYTHQALGNVRTGRALVQRALRVARAAGFEGVLKRRIEETTGKAAEPVPAADGSADAALYAGAPAAPVPPAPPAAPSALPADRPGPGTGPFTALSPAERRVASLAGAGYSNRDIAAKLFVTVSTIEQHLTRVYRKLKVEHRDELAAVCASLQDAAVL